MFRHIYNVRFIYRKSQFHFNKIGDNGIYTRNDCFTVLLNSWAYCLFINNIYYIYMEYESCSAVLYKEYVNQNEFTII